MHWKNHLLLPLIIGIMFFSSLIEVNTTYGEKTALKSFSTPNAEYEVPVGQDGVALGITKITVLTNNQSKIIIYELDRKDQGQIEVAEEDGIITYTLLKKGSKWVSISVHEASKSVLFVSPYGEKALYTFDNSERVWAHSQDSDPSIIDIYRNDFTLLMVVYTNVIGFSLYGEMQTDIYDNFADDVACVRNEMVGSYCTGPWHNGAGFDYRKSWACEKAKSNVNGQCSNYACSSCCQMLPCDCVCLFGDFFCNCQVSGRECGSEMGTIEQ